jgi:hypothetical protein
MWQLQQQVHGQMQLISGLKDTGWKEEGEEFTPPLGRGKVNT